MEDYRLRFISRELSAKYSQSQNYHYTKNVNEIINCTRTPMTVKYRDFQTIDTSEEMLNKFYCFEVCKDKQKLLGEYYKFHNDIPRVFMLPAMITLNYFHDKKRRLEYYRIARMIEIENKNNPDKPAKGIVGDSPLSQHSEQVTQQTPSSSDVTLKSKILEGLSCLQTDKSEIKKPAPFVNFKTQLQQYQKTVNNKGLTENIREQICNMMKKKNTGQESARVNVPSARAKSKEQQLRNSSLTNILSMLKTAQQPKKKKPPTIHTQTISISKTPREIKSCQSSGKIVQLFKTQTPRTNHSPNMPKIQQLELKVMSDLQSLLRLKGQSLTQRIDQPKKKKCLRELNVFKGPLSSRVQFKRAINTSGDHQMYYQQNSARQPQSVTQSTFTPNSQSESGVANKQHNQQPQSQLYKAALQLSKANRR